MCWSVVLEAAALPAFQVIYNIESCLQAPHPPSEQQGPARLQLQYDVHRASAWCAIGHNCGSGQTVEAQHLALQVTAGWEPGADLGPVISKESKARIESLIGSGINQASSRTTIAR